MSRQKQKLTKPSPGFKIYKNILLFLLLATLVAGAASFKAIKIKKNEHFNPLKPGSLFYSETAFHYRHAQIIAESKNNPLQILSRDAFIQYPETINVFKYYTLVMEFICGYAYRFFPWGLPFNLFLIYFTCFFSSLPLVGVFLITKRLCQSDAIALGASLFYLATPISYLRMLTAPFLYEDYALVFILLSAWLMAMLLDKRPRPAIGVITGLLMVIALSCWHFSQFIYLCMLVFYFWIFAKQPQLLKNFLLPLLIVLAASFLVPVLATSGFALSFFMCAGYSMAGGYFLLRRFRHPGVRLLLVLALFFAMVFIRNIFGPHEQAYSHVFGLFFEKLKFILHKPDNPLLLSFNARQLWEGAFNSPTLAQIWQRGKFTFPLGIIGAFWLLWKERKEPQAKSLIASVTLVLLILSVMVERILMVAAPFACVALWGCLPAKNNYKFLVKVILLILLGVNFMGTSLKPGYADRFIPSSFSELCDWITSHTEASDPILARISVSPMILLNTGRPEIVHPKFENLPIRKKYEEFITALYRSDEEELYAFCKRHGAKYFVYDWAFFIPDDKDSLRYLAGKVPVIPEETTATRLQFLDQSLKHFTPLYQNVSFVVYKINDEKPLEPARGLAYSPIYDTTLYTKIDSGYGNTRNTYDTVILPYANEVSRAINLLRQGKAKETVSILEPAVKRIPRAPNAVYLLALAFMELGDHQKAQDVLDNYLNLVGRGALAVEPFGAQLLELKADALYAARDFDKSFEALKDCLNLPFHSPEVYQKLGILSRARQDHEQADYYLKQYKAFREKDPSRPLSP